jgi:DNA-binding transcriptional ArsR family regulator
MIELLAKKSSTVSEIAKNFDVSLVAVSKHLKILSECGLIRITVVGRERHCHATLGTLQEVSAWVTSYEEFWKKGLGRLKYILENKKK